MTKIYNFIFIWPKHPVRVHIWAGISKRGRIGICVSDSIMDCFLFCDNINETLLLFLVEKFQRSHRFMQDNDPKHMSNYVITFLQHQGVNWWRTPAESPDLNPIENLWHELKEFNSREVKPQTKEELVAGIIKFWDIVTIEKCKKYINHLKKVIPMVTALNGATAGY